MFPIILGVAIAFGIVTIASGITLLDALLTKENQNTTTSIEVPSVVDDIYNTGTINSKLDPTLFRVTVDYVYDASVPENTIIKQDPEAGVRRKVKKNKQFCNITLTVSRGAETLKMPDYSMLEYRAVQLKAEKLGFRCVLKGIASEEVEMNYVIYTEPAAKSDVTYGSTVTIYYSIGSSLEKIEMPKLTDLTPTEAYAKMNGNFRVGQVTYENSDTVPEGKIVFQSIAAGTPTVKGTKIDFVISKGPLPVTTVDTETTDPSDTSGAETQPPETEPEHRP